MAKSTGIVLTAGGIAFANEWLNGGSVNLRIPVATLGVAVVFAGIEKLDETAAVGLSIMMLVLALVTPINGKAPAQTVVALMQTPNKAIAKAPNVKVPK